MNEHFRTFIEFGRRLANERGINWDIRLQEDGISVPEDAWNITQLVGDSPPPAHWVRDFGLDAKTLQIMNEAPSKQGQEIIEKAPLSAAWQDLLKATVMEQLFFKKNTTGHVVQNVARPLRVLATTIYGREPWELQTEDIVYAFDVARQIQASGKLADLLLGIVKTLIDANHIADIGPLSPALDFSRQGVRNKRAKYTKSSDQLRSELEERKHAEKLPERRAFWELVRIVFTEKPRSFLDQLRFAQVKVMLLCGLRGGEASLLPADWKRVREYYDPSGQPAGKLGGYSQAMMLRHFAEKQQSAFSDSIALFETTQYVPAMFEEILADTLDQVVTLTQPLRETLRRQVEENRILPAFNRDELVPAAELYPYLTGNPVLVDMSDAEKKHWQEKYREQFDSQILNTMHENQLRHLRSEPTLSYALYVFYNRLKGKLQFRRWSGSEWSDPRMSWSEVFLRIDEVEDYLAGLTTKLSDRSSLRLSPNGDIKAWECMFLMPKRALAEGRNDGICDVVRYYSVGRYSPEMTQLAIGATDSPKASPTLFETYGETDEDRSLKLNPHSLRHLQNTELFRLGVADTVITKRFNRKSVAQSYEYDHRSLAEDLEHIELPADVEIALGGKAATVARMIKAGKASGPIVDSFKHIQKTQGDDAAFEYLKVEADGFHSTPYGHCINSFTVDPCPKHLECFSGCRHLTATDMPKYRNHLVQLEGKFEKAVATLQARPASTIGRDNQLTHASVRLEAVRKILATPHGQVVFPDGKDFSMSHSQQRSVLDVSDKS